MGLRTTTAHPGLLHVVLCEPVTMVGAQRASGRSAVAPAQGLACDYAAAGMLW